MSSFLEEEFEPQYHTRDEALRIAQAEAERAFKELPKSISYVGYSAAFCDYCFCEFLSAEGGWFKTVRSLTPEERLPREKIRDESIRELANSGNMVAAIRLYRAKHQGGLRVARDAVQAMLR